MKNKGKVIIRCPVTMEVTLNSEFARLMTELTELQKKGVKSKRLKFNMAMLKEVLLQVGLDQLKTLSYFDVEKKVKKIRG